MRALKFIFRKPGLFIILFAALSMAQTMPGGTDHVPGRLLAVPRRGVDAARISGAIRMRGAAIRAQVPGLNLHILDVAEESSGTVMQSLRDSGLFETVEPDYYAHLAAAASVTPNDPSYPNQWHLPKISAPQAWSTTTGTASVLIAVIDSGVDPTHPDLSSKLTAGWNFVANSSDTSDAVGHGTAVAGTVAAASNNNIGVTGVSWNSKIMPLVVVDANEFASYSNIATAIQYAVDNGASVINISIGGPSASSVLQTAVDYAWSHNVVIFASAMNNSSSAPNYPAACNHAMGVSATDATDSLASFSNYGNWITLSAPGSNILTTTVGGGYGYWFGTSFASPIAAGVAALALAVNPSMTAPALVSLLEQNSDDLGTPGFDSSFGWGRVNAYKVVTAAQPASTVATAPLTSSLNAGQTQQFTATLSGSGSTTVTWSLAPAVGSISTGGLYAAPGSVSAPQTIIVTATAGTATASSTVTLVPVTAAVAPLTTSLNAGQAQQFTATVTGATNSAVSWSLNPAVGSISTAGLYTAPASVTATQNITVTATAAGGTTALSVVTLVPLTLAPATASLNAGQTQQFRTNSAVDWSLSPAVGTILTNGLYTAPASVTSTQTVTLTVTAVGGATASSTITLVPLTVAPLSASLNAGQTQQFTSNSTVSWSLNPAVGSISTAGLYTAPASVTSTQTVTVTATTASGATASARVTLAPIAVTVAPLTASLNAGQTQQFTASTTVTWSLVPALGSISTAGLYTAPAAVSSTQTVTVTATSGSGTAASSTVTLAPVAVAVSPGSVNLTAGQTQQFSATVTGATNTAVTWSLNPVLGSISAAGLYSAPASLTATQTVTVTATGATGAKGSAMLTISPLSTSTSGTFTPIRVNSGGAAYVDTLGQTWAADYGFTGGNLWSTTGTVANNPAPALYQTCRWGNFSYSFPAPNGSYQVTLKFADPSMTGPGQRVFSVALNGAQVLTNFDISATAGGMMIVLDESFPVTVTNGQINIQFIPGSANWPMVNGIQIVQAPQTAFTPIRVNATGPAYVDPLGQQWSADTGFTGGNPWSTTQNIGGTIAPALYQTCRWGAFGYSFAVPNGSYTVNLKFAEISLNGPGQRLFNVGINGSAVLTNFDIYGAAGFMTAVDRSFPVTVTNGQINLQFTPGSANWPLINAIEILSATAPAIQPSTIRVHSSGPAYTDSKGQGWAPDMDFTGGNTWSTSSAISGTSDPTLYQTCRWGVFSYSFALPNGSYTVNLKFAEISRTAVGQRQFNVAINGQQVLTNFDIVAAAGGPMQAIDKPFTAAVSNGQLVIQFTAGAADLPLINSIEVTPSAKTGSSPQLNDTPYSGEHSIRRRP